MKTRLSDDRYDGPREYPFSPRFVTLQVKGDIEQVAAFFKTIYVIDEDEIEVPFHEWRTWHSQSLDW